MATIPLTITGIQEAKRQLAEVSDEFEKFKNDPIESKKLAKQFNDLSKQIDEANNAFEELDKSGKRLSATFEEIYGEDLKPLSGRIGELEDRLYEMALAGQAGSDEFRELSLEVGKMKNVIIDVDKSIDLLSENQGLAVFGTGITQIGERLLMLDFQGAAKDATAMNAAVGNLSKMGSQAITGLAKTVGQLGKAFMSIGKALLTNPIFLLVAAVTAIGTAIVFLMNKLGLLKPILDTIGEVFGAIADAIQWVVDKIKEFLDWIGLTNFAAEEMAAKQQDAMQKIIDRSNELAESIGDRYDHEIRLAKIAGKDTTEQEIEKQKAIIKTAEVRQKAIDQLIEQNKITNKLTEEEIEKLKELRSETEKTIRESNQEIEALNAQRTQDQKNALEKERQDAKASYEKMLADRKKFEQDRLAAIRQIRDLELEIMDEGINKDLAINQEKYARLIADTLANENLLQEEKDNIVALLKQQEFEKNKEIELGYAQALSDALKEADKQRTEAAEEERKEKEEREAAYNEMLLESQRVQLEKQQAQEEAYREARVSLAENTISALQGIEQLLAATGAETAGLQKTIALVQIATDTAKAISAVVAGATAAAAAGGPAAPFLIAGYIASGIATVTSAIASAYSALKAAPPLGGSVGGGSVGGALSQAANSSQAPSVQLFGQNNDLNNLSAPQDVESSQEITVKAVVSETEITGTQNKIKKLQESAAL